MSDRGGDQNIIKVAVTQSKFTEKCYLGALDLREPLTTFIKVLCDYWRLSNPDQYGLQYSEPPRHYISEFNKNRIKNGVIMQLVNAVSIHADHVIKRLMSGVETDRHKALDMLVDQSSDQLFADEIMKLDGVSYIMKFVEEDKFDSSLLPNALLTFIMLMDHGSTSWSSITPVFIKKIVSYINSQQADKDLTESSLIILENIVLNSRENYAIVEKNITLPNVLRRISCEEVQQAVLGLVNALFEKSDSSKRKYYFSSLTSRQNRQIFTTHISFEPIKLPAEMQHQLYVLQHLLLNNYEDRINSPVIVSDSKCLELLEELRIKAFEERKVGGDSKESKKDYTKLGFSSNDRIEDDFEIPPGALALDFMIYFSRNRTDQYSKLVLENSCRGDMHDCPFAKASIHLIKILANIFKIGEPPREQGGSFYPMVFSHDHFFEELFCICIVLFNKTWKEMKATQEDFSKVVSVVQDQILRTLRKLPNSLDRFGEFINKLTYKDISAMWQKERVYNEEKEMKAPAIVELKGIIRPEVSHLITQHRLNVLIYGSLFRHKPQRGSKEKYWYCRLSQNHKYLHYGDCDEKSVPSVEDLKMKIAVTDIKDFLYGKDYPIKKDKGGKKYTELYAFSLILDTGNVTESNSVDFLTADESTYHYWIDGVNVLLKRRMTSPLSEKDLNLLLNMELKLRLLDTEGIPIPLKAPLIPPLPPNYDFFYQSG